MNVGIIGNYGHDNNGDEAILCGILTQLTDQLSIPLENITVFSNNPKNTFDRYGVNSVKLLHKKDSMIKSIAATIKESVPIMKQLDLLIIGGGGLLMDMYKRDAPLYSTLGILGHRYGCKVVIYGVGAGPINTKVGSFFIKKLLTKADSISVRDDQSRTLLLNKLNLQKEIQVIGDPAFAVPFPIEKNSSQNSIRNVAVTAVPYFSNQYWPVADQAKYNHYISGMAKNLDHLIETKQVKVTFFSTKYPQDIEVTKDIASRMENIGQTEILEDNLYPNDIVTLCAKQDLVIGTRLHSLILSLVAETPIIGIGYHQKVFDFMDRINQTASYLDINTLSTKPDFFTSIVDKMDDNWSQTLLETKATSTHLKNEAAKGLAQFEMIGE